MADEKNVLGILFGVEGGGDISKGSGKLIVDDLTSIVNAINSDKSKLPQIKFDFDFSAIETKLTDITRRLKELAAGDVGSGGKNTSKTKADTEAQKDANKVESEGIDLLKKKLKLEKDLKREQTRNKNITVSGKDEPAYASINSDDYTLKLVKSYNTALQNYKKWAGANSETLESDEWKAQSRILQAASDAQGAKFTRNGLDSWSKLSAKVNDYIQRVELAASRDKKAAAGLKEMADIANSGDPKRYDELNKKLYEVRGYINANSLATETWGQKIKKVFGDSVRSTMVASATALLAQTTKEIYDNVEKLDKSVVNLQIASGKTREEVQRLVRSYSDMAQQLGATTEEVAESADTWLRQGYNMEETNTLIKNGMMLSKLGQIDATTATTDLTSAMKGYQVSVEDSLGIVDKLTAVDMAAAASAGGLATSMAETATGANLAGVSMDKLLGYIAAVKEVTQDADESVGNFYKVLFARMGNVKAGKFADGETGESLNDVEKVLNARGIKLRDSETQFRNFGVVLDEIAAKWSTLDGVSQRAIATALASKVQAERFITLMENYGTATKYAEIAANASGTATEKWSAYMDSAEAKTNSVTAALEKLSQSMINSDWIVMGKGVLAWLINGLATITDYLGGLPGLSAIALAALGKNTTPIKRLAQFLTPKKFDADKVWGGDFTKALETDITAINKYVESVKSGTMDANAAFETFMVDATGDAQQFVQQNAEVIKEMESLTDASAQFRQQERLAQLGESAASSYQGAKNAIRLYRDGLESAGITTEEFHAAIAKANPELDKYIMNLELKGKQPSELGYWRLTHKATIETMGFTVAAMGLTAAVNGISKQSPEAANAMGVFASAVGVASTAMGVFKAVAKGAELTTVFGWISLALSAVVSAIGAFSSASQQTKAAWDDTLSSFEDTKSSIDAIEDGYISVQKYLSKLAEGEDVGDSLQESIASLNKVLGENRVNFDEAGNSAAGYGEAVTAATKEALIDKADEAGRVVVDAQKKIASQFGTKSSARGRFRNFVSSREKDIVFENMEEYLPDDGYSPGYRDIIIPRGESEAETAGNFLKYYAALKKTQRELFNAKLTDSEKAPAYDTISTEIKKAEEDATGLTSALYEQAKANFEVEKGIPGTKEQYKELTEWLGNAAGASEYLREQFKQMAEDDFATKIPDFYGLTEGNGIRGSRVEAKSAGDYLNEIQEGYDGLSSALKQCAEDGYLSAESLSNLYSLQEQNKLGGLNLDSVIRRTADGYTLASYSLEHYVDVLIAANSNYKEFATVQDSETAIENLLNLRAVLLTLQRTQAASAAADKKNAAKDALEKQKDALNDQIDKYKKLIELRKKLLQTYEDERKYQKELSKKQQNLANLQTQLSVSTLDTSAAGIARTRELSNQVTEAQDALDDYTLEHAVQQIENDLDEQYSEYEVFIEGKMEAIEKAIKSLDTTARVTVDASWVDGALSDTDALLAELRRQLDADGAMIEEKFDAVIGKMQNAKFEVENKGAGRHDPKFTVSQMYHSGGVVGGEALKHNEEFAKLLKGEFVSTPAQMQKFMNDTLPRMVTYTGRSNEFNAPLITINCDNVTSEAMPKLKEVVNEAVEKIKQELNSGMSRAGYKGTVQKLLV